MNHRQLRYFCEVVDAGSSVAAAVRLNVAPTAISMQITQLEDNLEGALFDRSRRPMSLTALGKFFYPRAKELLKAASTLTDDARIVAAGQAGWLAVGYTRSSIFSVLPRAMRRFRESEPRAQLELLTMLGEHQPEQLRMGRIQIGIGRYISPPPATASLVYTPLFADPFCLAVPVGFPFANTNRAKVADLRDIPLITYPKDVQSVFAEHTLDLLRRAGGAPNVVHEAHDIHTALGFVASGLGCALVGQSTIAGSRRDIGFVELTDLRDDFSTVYAVAATGHRSALIDAFLTALVRAGRDVETLVEREMSQQRVGARAGNPDVSPPRHGLDCSASTSSILGRLHE